jgi:cell division protein FtsQ
MTQSASTRAKAGPRIKWRRHGARLALAAVFFAMLAGWAGGAFSRMAHHVSDRINQDTAELGFRIADVAVQGRNFTTREEILAAVGVHEGDPILAFDPAAARAALEALPRIASADVERRLPDTVAITIVERAPIAIWQKNGKMTLIDRDGVVLGDSHLSEYSSLPMVVGDGAAKPAAAIIDAVTAEPALAKRVSAYIRVGGRRWDLKLDNNVEVKLPETGAETAVHRIAAMETSNGLFERDVVAVDLRLAGKTIVETGQIRDPKHKNAPQQGI